MKTTEKSKKYQDLIDILLDKGVIDERHCLAIMKFRWMYAKTFGNSQVKSCDLSKIRGRELATNEEFLEKISFEYKQIREILVKEKMYQILFDVAIMNILPKDSRISQMKKFAEAVELFEKNLIKVIIERKKNSRFTFSN